MRIAQVALPIKIDQLFDYIVPDHLLDLASIGKRVKSPFGHRQVIGIIVKLSDQSDYDVNKLKSLEEIIDNQALFPDHLWQLLFWAADYCHYPIGEVLFHAMPTLLRQGRKAVTNEIKSWQLTDKGKYFDPENLSRSSKQKQVIAQWQNNNLFNKINELEFGATVYKNLEKQGLIQQTAVIPPAYNWRTSYSSNPSPIQLNDEQYTVIQAINKNNRRFSVYLLEGITGSGKTEVYLNTIADILEQGKQALVLVPEIGLTPQTIERVKKRFNAPIDILHSGLSEKERLAVWLRSKNGENAIVVGTRSSLFTPFKDLGMIIIDEEHDTSYKQQEGWRYNARDLAIVRAKMENIPIILGSATPSLETLNNTKSNRYHHLSLTQRAGNATLVKQTILDIKGLVLCAGLSQPLILQIKKHLADNNQVMLFLNRRGYSPLIICHDCGWVAECPRCDRPYTYHQQQGKLICHHCDTPRTIPLQCPKCGSTHLVPIGFGTEQLENQLKILFPDVPISRIDRDSTSKKGALEDYLNAIAQGGRHLLVGTQILAKGHHFADVTLVGIIDVDGALFSSDFRATERFAQIYTQVSGRAGRENKSGEVILQTYHPDHPLLNILLNEGYQAFANQTLQERQITLLPPFSYQVLIRGADRNNQSAPQFLQKIHDVLKHQFNDSELWQLGPVQASQPKKAGYNRWQLLLQHTNRTKLHAMLSQLVTLIEQWPEAKNLRWSIDVDPIDSI